MFSLKEIFFCCPYQSTSMWFHALVLLVCFVPLGLMCRLCVDAYSRADLPWAHAARVVQVNTDSILRHLVFIYFTGLHGTVDFLFSSIFFWLACWRAYSNRGLVPFHLAIFINHGVGLYSHLFFTKPINLCGSGSSCGSSMWSA